MSKAAQIGNVIRRQTESAACWVGQEYNRPAVALSGGVDSCAVLASFMEAEVRPVVISYTPSTHESTDFQMARETADNLGLEFIPAVFDMADSVLDKCARYVIGLGWYSKVQVESLAPMVLIGSVAKRSGVDVVLTGDQSDGYFALSKWAAHNYDRKQGVPFRERSRSVKHDTTSDRIDGIRKRYYEEDFSCSEAVRQVLATYEVDAVFPFRDPAIRNAFIGSLWSEVNEPRVKEPVRLAWDEYFADDGILVRPVQVNLHKGDSYFGDTLNSTMMEMYPTYVTARGLYSAIYRGEV